MRNIATDAKDQDGDYIPKPDYTITWRELYTKLAVNAAERGDTDVLRFSGTLQHGQDAAIHSWVPDWQAYPKIQYLVHGEWSAGSKRPFQVKMNRIPKKRQRRLLNLLPESPHVSRMLQYTMSVSTVMQDEIWYLGGLVRGWKKHKDIQHYYQDVIAADEASIKQLEELELETYITSESLIDAYNAILIANTTDQDTLASPSYLSDGVSAWRAWLRNGCDLSAVPELHEAVDNLETFREKQFCITKRGYFCLVPASAQPTDLVAFVKGLDMPLLLRPVDTCYVYVGECYVHGMMEFQATNFIDEFSVKIREGKPVWKPEGDVRRNGRSLDIGDYKRILETLGERRVELI